MENIVHLVNREYDAMAKDYYKLGFLDPVMICIKLLEVWRHSCESLVTSLQSDM